MKTLNRDWVTVFIFLVKRLPIFTAVMLMVHEILELNGVHETIIGGLVGVSPIRTMLMLTASLALGFCKIHRMFIVYNFVVCLYMRHAAMYGMEQMHMTIFLVVGVILLTLLACKKAVIGKCSFVLFKRSYEENNQ